ncbi:MAG: GTP 3',8-cyclase MoaA [Acidimicrobiales bacterium]|jgi:cyclic pyranopterin phosphate synthase|nr:GTP 3',8-cyclase MoaA [Acidimicrobiales bacterium]
MAPHADALTDTFGRVHRDLRISVTDRCNFRCTYCMPAEGMPWLPRQDLLTYEELARVARVCVERFGFDGIRLTGGEPTVRAHLPVLVEKLAALDVDLALTTNGSTLRLVAHDLAAAGLRRINVSCDSLRPERFADITKRDELARVLDGVQAALEAGLAPVKLNVVVMRGVNDDEIVDFAAYGRETGVTVRFIEFMPLDAQGEWTNDQVVGQSEIVAAVDAVFPLEPVGPEARGSAPADRWRYLDGAGEIGVIASVTQAFCDSCDRVRLTAEGMLRHCLFATRELDLRTLLRSGASDDDLADAIRVEVGAKWAGHQINQVHFIRPSRSMSQIGG